MIQPTFRNTARNFAPLYYSITCHDTFVIDGFWDNTSGAIGGSNVSDYSAFDEWQT